MRHWRAAAVFLWVAAALAADASREKFEAGVRSQKLGDLVAASTAYRQALATNPKLTVARYLLGVCELQLGRRGEGIALLETVRREDPRNVQAAQTLVSAYIAAGLLGEAKSVLESTLRADRTPGTGYVRGLYQLAVGDYEASVAEFVRAGTADPRLPGVASQLGIAYCFANRHDEALPVLEEAVRVNPQDANAVAFLGWLYKDRGRDSEATALLGQAFTARPEDTGALFLLAQLAQSRGETGRALDMLEKVVAREPGHRAAHVLLARVYHQLNRPTEATRERQIVERLNAEIQASQPRMP